MPSGDVDDSRVIEDVYVCSEITSVVKDTLVNSSTPILDEVHVSFEDTSNVMDVLESNTPIPHDMCVHEADNSEFNALHLLEIPRQ